MSESDQLEAMQRKEVIWNDANPESKKESKVRPWMILLLGPLFFLSGWFLKPTFSSLEESSIRVEQKEISQPMSVARVSEFENMEVQFNSKLGVIDSLLKVNSLLQSKVDKHKLIQPSVANSNNTHIIRDTIYLTNNIIEEKQVEKIIRDTVFIELPLSTPMDPIVANSENAFPKEAKAELAELEDKSTPSSIQFNFSVNNQKQ